MAKQNKKSVHLNYKFKTYENLPFEMLNQSTINLSPIHIRQK